MKGIKERAKEMFADSPRCQRTWLIDPSMPSSKFRKDTEKLPRWQASLLAQLCTGHIPLQKHLHRIGKAESPTCPKCRSDDETVIHYLLRCPVYTAQRRRMESALHRAAISVSTLLANPKAFHYLFEYIHSTQ